MYHREFSSVRRNKIPKMQSYWFLWTDKWNIKPFHWPNKKIEGSAVVARYQYNPYYRLEAERKVI